MTRPWRPGFMVALALVNGNRFVWEEAFGFSNASGDGPGARLIGATPDTRFGVGEVGRLLAAVAVLKLADEGRVSLDAPVAAHLPAFRMVSPGYRGISLRMLLGQTSGIPGTAPRNRFTTVPFADHGGQVLDDLALQRLNHAPGTLPVPCGDGFTVVQECIRAVTGLAYIDYVKREILDPLGMRNCSFIPDPRPRDDPYARAFDGMRRHPLEYANAYASCGFYASAPDMARLMAMLLDGGRIKGDRILEEASVREMGRRHFPPEAEPLPSPVTAFGLGWKPAPNPRRSPGPSRNSSASTGPGRTPTGSGPAGSPAPWTSIATKCKPPPGSGWHWTCGPGLTGASALRGRANRPMASSPGRGASTCRCAAHPGSASTAGSSPNGWPRAASRANSGPR